MSISDSKPFPDVFGLSDYVLPGPRTLPELCMLKLSASIRSKHAWWIKYKDLDIRSRWKEETLATKMVWIERATMLVPYEGAREAFDNAVIENMYSFDDSVVQLNEKQVEYVLDELDGYAKLRDEETGIQVSSFDGVWHSDTLVSENLCDTLKKGVAELEDVPESQKDWHPDSNNQVLDLVHPSLYSVVYGCTPAYPRESDPSTQTSTDPYPIPTPNFRAKARESLCSKRFQWLPTDFSIAEDGTAKALGYINNLHPSHGGLYASIERILGAFVPLFERVLTDMVHPLPFRVPGIFLPLEECDPNYPKQENSEEYDSYEGRCWKYRQEEWLETKFVGLPDVPAEGYTGGRETRSETISLRDRTVQVIVKLANIHLTPENPEYKGGSWHIEGMANERIVASGLYYYDQENITSSELAFRIAVAEPYPSTQGQAQSTYDYDAHYRTWGMVMDDGDSTLLTNVVGATATLQGRCLAFPNTYQHRLAPFHLVDPSKPGHRKLLAFFLVDPHIALIPSTTIVPPQQRSWALRALRDAVAHRLPPELFAMIEEQADGLMGEEEARALRLELMAERTAGQMGNFDYFGHVNEYRNLFSRVFNLCEH